MTKLGSMKAIRRWPLTFSESDQNLHLIKLVWLVSNQYKIFEIQWYDNILSSKATKAVWGQFHPSWSQLSGTRGQHVQFKLTCSDQWSKLHFCCCCKNIFMVTKLQSQIPYIQDELPIHIPMFFYAVHPFDIHTAFEGHFVKTGDQPNAGTTPVRCFHLDADHTNSQSW